jgi:DNA-binding beta-propeller fold protein YncE
MSVRRSVLVCLASLCGLVGGLVFGSAGALAAFSYPFDGQLVPAGGSFGSLEAGSVAVDDANGHTYVADSGSGVVDVFETVSGTQLASWSGSAASNPPGTPVGSFGGGQVAVAVNNATGDVYVLDSTDSVVDVFEPSGGYVGQITGAGTPAGGFKRPGGITVDQATGEVYVVDAENGVVDIFSAAGVYSGRQISLASIPDGFYGPFTRGIAVDDQNGDVYVSYVSEEPSFQGGVAVFNTTGAYLATWHGENTPAGSFGRGLVSVAADNASGVVYVADLRHGVTDVFEPSGEYTGQFSHSFNNPLGTAVDQATHKVYVSDNEPGVVDVFGPVLVIPSVTTGSASEVGPTGATLSSATLNGTVNPDGLELKDCHFQYGTDTSYGQSAPCVPAAGSIPADSNVHAVSARIVGLTADTVYHFRLVAANENDAGEPNTGEDATFQTPPPPSIDSAAAVNVTGVSADLTAKINPNGFDTHYRFEWGTSTAYGTTVPVPDADVGAGTSDVLVSTHLSGLAANTTYHWRIIAENANGAAVGAGDHTFIYDTAGGGLLPDGRAYEMVTPPNKNGAAVGHLFGGIPVEASEDGSRVVAVSIQCFAGPSSCSASRLTEGEPYAFTRTTGGWVTTPLAPPLPLLEQNSQRLFSADSGGALFSIPTPPMGEDDWYVREPDGSFVDIGPVTSPSLGKRELAAEERVLATVDLSHVVFEYGDGSGVGWPFDATIPISGQGFSLFEYVGGGNSQPVLVGVSGGLGSTDLISRCGTRTSDFRHGAMSADGGTVFFTAGGGAKCFGSGVNEHTLVPADALYARIDESRTVAVSVRSPLDCTSAACLSSSPGEALFKGAKFVGASADGSRVFFTDTQQLTDSASEDNSKDSAVEEGCSRTTGVNGCNLYMYDFGAPAGHNLVAVSAGDSSGGGPRVQGVMAVSSDGSHVYFVAKGVLSGAANSQGQVARDGALNLYVFERDAAYPAGRVSFVATLSTSDYGLWVAPLGHNANVTPDGRFLVFESHGLLTADDTSGSGGTQVFRYDAQSGALVRVSIGERGFNDNGNAGTGDAIIAPADLSQFRDDPSMSHDGAFVFFQSPVGLTPGALNDVPIDSEGNLAQNVYEWHEGHVYLISDGRDTSASVSHLSNQGGASSVHLVGSDGAGANVFFETADRLVGQDTDTQVDVYDARTGGGFPYSPPPAPCQGEACRGVPGAAPSLLAPVSASFAGAGNLVGQAGPVAKAKKKHRVRHAHKKKKRHRARKGSAAKTGKHVKRGRR